MGFWLFMLTMDLLIPFTMIIFGFCYVKKPPKKVNMISGYRTSMSMKNMDTWIFAHNYCGKLMRVVGFIFLPLTVIVMVMAFIISGSAVGTFGGIVCGAQCVLFIAVIIPTELALRKNFDEQGNRRSRK